MSDRSAQHDSYQEAIRGLAGILVEGRAMGGTLEELLAVANQACPDVDALTITSVGDDGSYVSAASTDQAARAVDEFEYRIAEGPCIAALLTGEEQLVVDTHTDDRWPAFAAEAREAGFRTVAGLPLVTPEGEVQGALNVFVRAPHELSEADLALLRRVTTPAGVVLANARAYRRAEELSARLGEELRRQALWHRAIGVVLGRHEVDPETAERSLRGTAQQLGIDPDELARRLVAGETIELSSG